VVAACKKKLGVDVGETSADGMFTITEVECLGACVNAPVIQINNGDFYEDLDAASTERLLEALAKGERPKIGPQIDRQLSAPVGGKTTLTDVTRTGETKNAP
jgi:(2Fe-2S) ferredoxin